MVSLDDRRKLRPADLLFRQVIGRWNGLACRHGSGARQHDGRPGIPGDARMDALRVAALTALGLMLAIAGVA